MLEYNHIYKRIPNLKHLHTCTQIQLYTYTYIINNIYIHMHTYKHILYINIPRYTHKHLHKHPEIQAYKLTKEHTKQNIVYNTFNLSNHFVPTSTVTLS